MRSELNPRFYQGLCQTARWSSATWASRRAQQPNYNTALQLSPNYDVAYIGRGNLYRQAGRLDDAFGDFNRAIQLDTTDPRAYHNRGLIYQTRRQHEQAIEDFSKAISLSPNSAEPV